MANNVFAVTDNPAGGFALHTSNGSNWGSSAIPLGNQPAMALGIIGTDLLVGGTGGRMSLGGTGGTFGAYFTPTNVPSGTQIDGIWGDRSANKWYFVGTNAGLSTIYSMVNGNTVATAEKSSSMRLTAIAGRPAIGPVSGDIYVVGALGNQVYHSTGNGVWGLVQIPTSPAMNSVYVDPSGEVVAVGGGGTIAHFR